MACFAVAKDTRSVRAIYDAMAFEESTDSAQTDLGCALRTNPETGMRSSLRKQSVIFERWKRSELSSARPSSLFEAGMEAHDLALHFAVHELDKHAVLVEAHVLHTVRGCQRVRVGRGPKCRRRGVASLRSALTRASERKRRQSMR